MDCEVARALAAEVIEEQTFSLYGNDYRTHYGEYGEGKMKQRIHGRHTAKLLIRPSEHPFYILTGLPETQILIPHGNMGRGK